MGSLQHAAPEPEIDLYIPKGPSVEYVIMYPPQHYPTK